MSVYARYVRFRTWLRLRHSTKFQTWLEAQATRLGMTSQEILEDLMVKQGLNAAQVEAMPTPEPEPDPTP